MNNKGFTITEMMAVIIVIGMLFIIAVPAYVSMFTSIKRDNLNNKIKLINLGAEEYGEKRLDSIKDLMVKKNQCQVIYVKELIQKGYLATEDKEEDVIYNPVDKSALDDPIFICYDTVNYELKAIYASEYNSSKVYYKDNAVYNGTITKSGDIEVSTASLYLVTMNYVKANKYPTSGAVCSGKYLKYIYSGSDLTSANCKGVKFFNQYVFK